MDPKTGLFHSFSLEVGGPLQIAFGFFFSPPLLSSSRELLRLLLLYSNPGFCGCFDL